ncbi:nudC domain-containing protein 2-like isoform X1 [Tachypleus tridentatus]|uniref:nudC domain-containing protein 2-like isoform X1 n=1 Tax=Tachypleus tridentatus TaxID=6853 RepID=UPI003FD4AD44
MPLSHFDEHSSIVACETSWGRWWQTVTEVFIEISVKEGTRGKDVHISIRPKFIECSIQGKEILKGELCRTVVPDDSTWTVEEQKQIVILLTKAESPDFEKFWESLLIGQFAPDPWLRLEMMKKLDLERFQIENPGFDFSSAKLSKCYDNIEPTDLSREDK